MAALVFGYAILSFSVSVLADTASIGIFFETYDAAILPYTYLLLMLIGPLVSFILLRLNSRFTLSKSLLTIHVLMLLSLILLPILLKHSEAPVVRFLLPVYSKVIVILMYTSFWNLLGRMYNLRQGKRLFPVLSSAEHLAALGAGFMATFFIARFDPIDLFTLGASLMVGAIALFLVISRANEDKMGNNRRYDTEVAGPSHLKALAKESYVRLIFAVVIVYTLGVFIVDYLAFAEAEIYFPTAEEMATYVAIFMGIYGAFGLIIQWLIAGRLLDRFGVSTAFLSLPGGLFILVALFALAGSPNKASIALFLLAAAANMYAYTFDAFYTTSKNVMLQPLPAYTRTQVQTTSMGVVYPLATGLSGLLLLFLLNILGLGSVELSFTILFILAFWIVLGVRLSQAYVFRLRQVLQTRNFGMPALFRVADRSTISVLVEALSSPHPAVVQFALDMLVDVAPEVLPGQLPGLLTFPDDNVRLAALEHFGGLTWSKTPEAVMVLLMNSANPDIRAAALRAWYAIEPRKAGENLAEYKDDAQAPVRQAALVLMCHHHDVALRRQALEAVEALVQSSSPGERILASGVIGESGIAEDMGYLLLKLLSDGDSHVRIAALVAAACHCLPAYWPAVIPHLAQGKTRSLATSALACGGQEVLPLLQAVCQKQDQGPPILAGVALVCGRIDSPLAIDILLSLLDHPDATVRRQAFLGLGRSAYQAPQDQRSIFKERLRLQVKRLAEIVASQVDIRKYEDESEIQSVFLMVDALEQGRRIEMDNLLLLISFVTDPQVVLSVRAMLQSDRADDEKRAFAIEALDIMLDHTDKRLLFPFLQQLEPEQRLSNMIKEIYPTLLGREQRLVSLLEPNVWHGDRWIRLCAIHTLGLLHFVEAWQAIIETTINFGDDSILVESALKSLEQLGLSPEEIVAANPVLVRRVAQWQERKPGSLTLLQKAQSLRQISIYATLPSDALEALAGLMEVVAVEAEEMIIQKGDLGERLYVVLDGQLRAHDDGRIFEIIGAGGIVGEMALLDSQPRSASVTAITDSRLLELEKEPFSELITNFPQVAREILVLLSRRLRDRMADVAPTLSEVTMQHAMPVAIGKEGINIPDIIPGAKEDLDKLFILKGTDLFSRLEDNLLKQVTGLLEDINLSGGETLFNAGDPGHSLYVVAIGQVRVHIAERTIAYLDEGSVIGEMALLDTESRSASVTAVVPTQLLRIDQEPFFELMELQPELGFAMIKMVSGRLRTRLYELSV